MELTENIQRRVKRWSLQLRRGQLQRTVHKEILERMLRIGIETEYFDTRLGDALEEIEQINKKLSQPD